MQGEAGSTGGPGLFQNQHGEKPRRFRAETLEPRGTRKSHGALPVLM